MVETAKARRPPTAPRPTSSTTTQENVRSFGNSREKRKNAIIETIAFVQIPLVTLATAHQVKFPEQVSPYTLDVKTIEAYQEPLADSIVDLADSFPVIGVMLDKLATTSPFAGILGVAIAIGTQIAENHGLLPENMRGLNPGLMDRQEFANAVASEAQNRANQNGNSSTEGN